MLPVINIKLQASHQKSPNMSTVTFKNSLFGKKYSSYIKNSSLQKAKKELV